MNWKFYRLVFRLEAPLYVGHNKVGNIQQTYPYLPGRTFWGGLTARLGRDFPELGGYEAVGNKIHQEMVYAYFFPAICCDNEYKIYLPDLGREKQNLHELLEGYTSTAINSQKMSSEEASLHEFEVISPYTRDSGKQVFLIGYCGINADSTLLPLNTILNHIQVGGDRHYGWGQLKLETQDEINTPCISWFEGYRLEVHGNDIYLMIPEGKSLLAHTNVEISAHGSVEPLVARLWRNRLETDDKDQHLGAGQEKKYFGMYWYPGSRVDQDTWVKIGKFGLWEKTSL